MNNPQGFPNPSFPSEPPGVGPSAGGPPGSPFGPPAAGPRSSPIDTPAATPSWMPQDPPVQPSNSGRNVALGVMALIVVGGVAAVAFLVTSDDDDASTVGPATSVPFATLPATLESAPTVTVPGITELPTIAPATVPVPVTVAPVTTVAVVEAPNLFVGTQAAEVIAEIGVARGAVPLRILQAIIYPGYAFAQVQDPSIPVNVDEYQWRGTLSSPAPVTLTGGGDLEANLFSDTEVNWAAIPALVEAALAQIPIEGAEVTHVFVERNLPFTDTIQIRVFVNGTRGSGYLDADAQGNVLAVNQS